MEAKNITATYQIARSAPQIVLGDRVRLDHVSTLLLSYLLESALRKFNRH